MAQSPNCSRRRHDPQEPPIASCPRVPPPGAQRATRAWLASSLSNTRAILNFNGGSHRRFHTFCISDCRRVRAKGRQWLANPRLRILLLALTSLLLLREPALLTLRDPCLPSHRYVPSNSLSRALYASGSFGKLEAA